MSQIEQYKVDLITANLAAKGVTNFEIRNGNDCIWVSYGHIDAYYVFRDGKIVDIQVD
jgi:hypothetical protein